MPCSLNLQIESPPYLQIFVSLIFINPIRVKPGPGRPGLNEKSCQIEMNVLNLFSIGDFSSWSLLYPLKKLFLQYHHKNFEKSGPKVRWLPLELGKKHELTSVDPYLTTLGGTNWVWKSNFWKSAFAIIHNMQNITFTVNLVKIGWKSSPLFSLYGCDQLSSAPSGGQMMGFL